MISKKKFILITIIILLFLLLAFLGISIISESNEQYLNSAINRSLKTFGVLSTLKVGLSIIEGSEIGVGFGLQVGDVVQAAYDFVDISWKTVLAGGVVLIGTRYLLKALELIDHYFFVFSVILILIAYCIKKFYPDIKYLHKIFKDLNIIMIILTISIYIILPLSIYGGEFLSRNITKPSLEEAEKGLSNIKDNIFPDQQEDTNIISKWSGAKDRLDKISKYLKDQKDMLSLWGFKLIAGYLFDCVIFPLFLFIILFWLVRKSINYFLEFEI